MAVKSLAEFARLPSGALGPGPIAVVIAEDSSEVISTLAHIGSMGFAKIVLAAPPGTAPPESLPELKDRLISIEHGTRQPDTLTDIVNHVIVKAPGAWIHYCFNAEYLFFPFSEHRSIGEVAAFVEEERRNAVLTYVVDLYAEDLTAHPNGVSLETAHLDASGYYAEGRQNGSGDVLERQLNFYGGLRWRFEEHVAPAKRRIDRVSMFKAAPGLKLRPDHTLTDEEMNTFESPWHHTLTGAVCSFRVAKALRTNPGSRHDVPSFLWHRSERFTWTSQQLMDLGLMEPGQWF